MATLKGWPRGGRSVRLKRVKADDLQEPLNRRVGGSLSRLPALQRLACSSATPRSCVAVSGNRPRTMEPSFAKLLARLANHGVHFLAVGGVAVTLQAACG